jgi:hypothetical protein
MFAQDEPDAFPGGYSDSAYLSGVEAEMAYVTSHKPAGLVICANGFANPTLAIGVAPYVDRGMVETFAHTPAGYNPLPYWTMITNDVLTMSQGYGKTLRVILGGPQNDAQVRIFAFASYLLVMNSNTAYDYNVGLGNLYPEELVRLGAPTQTFSSIDQAWVAADGTYERTFAGGRVIVNPSSTATTPRISLGGTYKIIALHGGALQNSGYSSTTSVTSVQLGPDSAAILLR